MFDVGAIEIRFAVMGEVQLRRRLEGVLAHTEDLRPALQAIAKDFHATMAEVFQSEGEATAGGRWRDLSPAYAKWKAKHYPGRKILELDGRMRASLVSGSGEGAIERYEGDHTLVVGTAVVSKKGYPYAIAHQQGRGRNPVRKIIDLSDPVKRRWVKIMQDHVWSEPEK